MRALLQHAASRLSSLLAIAAFGAGCAKTAPPAGLMIIVRSNLTVPTELNRIRVEVSQEQSAGAGPWHKWLDATKSLPTQATLPTTVFIQSGTAPDQNALIQITALLDGTPLVLREVQLQIPTDRVAALELELDKVCKGQVTIAGGQEAEPMSTCAMSGQSCQPATGMCGSNLVDSSGLPTYTARESLDAGISSTDGASQATEASNVAESGTPDARAAAGADGSGAPDAHFAPMFASCAAGGAGMTNCGASSESCCTTLAVPGGTFYRLYVNSGGGPSGEVNPATVSSFALDKYVVTIGRFRQFVNAWKIGWVPPQRAGKHGQLNAGNGLNVTGGGYEPGWAASYDVNITPTDANLACDTINATWTSAAGTHENLPVACVNWYEAYAFCIWDGGFLPTEAEWEYAAAGGSEQLEYPWGSTVPGTACPGTGCQYAIFNCQYPSGPAETGCMGMKNVAPVGTASLGAGRWGQLDLVGEVVEWTMDSYVLAYVEPCTDCVNLTDPAPAAARGDSFQSDGSYLRPTSRNYFTRSNRVATFGFRCARAP